MDPNQSLGAHPAVRPQAREYPVVRPQAGEHPVVRPQAGEHPGPLEPLRTGLSELNGVSADESSQIRRSHPCFGFLNSSTFQGPTHVVRRPFCLSWFALISISAFNLVAQLDLKS